MHWRYLRRQPSRSRRWPSRRPAGRRNPAPAANDPAARRAAGRPGDRGHARRQGPVRRTGAGKRADQDVRGSDLRSARTRTAPTFDTFAVQDGGLDNVFVYVKDGLGNYYFDTPTEPVTLDQTACHYEPHVFGIRVGQPLEIVNDDTTLHNVHAMPTGQPGVQLPPADPGDEEPKTFTAREVMVPFKCDVHGWMNAYAGVLDHPYFAVTTGGGHFELKNVPAGHLHCRGLARTARHTDAAGHDRRKGNEGRELHLQAGRVMKSNAEAAVLTPARTRTADFVALAKPRLNLLVVGSALAGYAMAGGDTVAGVRSVVCTVVGTALVAGGASAYNQILERRHRRLMQRTRLRPLPDGRLQVGEALVFATALSALGLATLAVGVNTL